MSKKSKEILTEEGKKITNCLVVVGEVTQAQKEAFLEAWNKWQAKAGHIIIEADPEEIKPIVELRKTLKQSEQVRDFLTREQNHKDAMSFAHKLIEEMAKANRSYKEEGDGSVFPHKRQWKDLTDLSWSRFNSIINTLDLFGMVQILDVKEPNYFRIVLSDAEIVKVEEKKIQVKLEELKEAIEISRTVINDNEAKKKLAALKRKLSLKL